MVTSVCVGGGVGGNECECMCVGEGGVKVMARVYIYNVA